MDLATNLDFVAFTAAVGDVLPLVVPVALGLIAITVGWRFAKKFIKQS